MSHEFLERGVDTFCGACSYAREVPYGRNNDLVNKLCVFNDNRGTCSTKHALLKALANENDAQEVRLFLGIVEMSAENTPEVAEVLRKYELLYIPEAHTYLKAHGRIIDCTKTSFPADGSGKTILAEIEIQPHQIGDYKVKFHQEYLRNWLFRENVLYSPEEIWSIREQCIAALSGN